MNDGDDLKYLLTDHLGSVVAVLSEAGTLISEQRYREAPPECPEGHGGGMPFGEVRAEVGTISQAGFGYTGQRSLFMLSIMDLRQGSMTPEILFLLEIFLYGYPGVRVKRQVKSLFRLYPDIRLRFIVQLDSGVVGLADIVKENEMHGFP